MAYKARFAFCHFLPVTPEALQQSSLTANCLLSVTSPALSSGSISPMSPACTVMTLTSAFQSLEVFAAPDMREVDYGIVLVQREQLASPAISESADASLVCKMGEHILCSDSL